MVKKTGSHGSHESTAVPTCEECGKRPWTDWRPNFQKYLCTECDAKHASRAMRVERRVKRRDRRVTAEEE